MGNLGEVIRLDIFRLTVVYLIVRGVMSLAEIRLQEGESIENALRRFKRKVMTEDIIKEIKRHWFPSPMPLFLRRSELRPPCPLRRHDSLSACC